MGVDSLEAHPFAFTNLTGSPAIAFPGTLPEQAGRVEAAVGSADVDARSNEEVFACDPTSFPAPSSLITSFPTTPRNVASYQSCKDRIRWFSFSAVEATVPRIADRPKALFNSIARWKSAIAGSLQ